MLTLGVDPNTTTHNKTPEPEPNTNEPPKSIWRAGLLIFAIALAVRVVYLIDSADYPAFTTPIVDARVYDDAARQWLAQGTYHDVFFWQPFFYPFVLAVQYGAGASILAVKMLQVMLGALTCALTAVLGQRLFGRSAGTCAGLILAFYGPLIFYEVELLATGWATFWTVTLLLLALRLHARLTWRSVLLFGLAGGLSALTRPTFLPCFILIAVWLIATNCRVRATRQRAALSAVLLALGFAVATTPVALLNLRENQHFGFLPHSGGINTYLGNHPDPCRVATAVGLEFEQLSREPLRENITAPYDQQRYFYDRVRRDADDDPIRFLRSLGSKALQFVSSRELPRNVNLYDTHEWSGVQRVLLWKWGSFGFPLGVVLPLAILGVLTNIRKLPGIVWTLLIAYPMSIVFVFVTARYRIPYLPILAVLAGAGLTTLTGALRTRHWHTIFGGLIVIVATLPIITLPGPFCLERDEHQVGLFASLGLHHLEQGDYETAYVCFQEELRRRPESFRAHNELAGMMLSAGRNTEAVELYRWTVTAKPHIAATHNNLAVALLQTGDASAAEASARRALAIEPYVERYFMTLGLALMERQHVDDAIAAMRKAVELRPENPDAHAFLGTTLALARRFEQAADAFAHAVTLDPFDLQNRLMLAQALADAGRIDAAIREFEHILEIQPNLEAVRQRLKTLRAQDPKRQPPQN